MARAVVLTLACAALATGARYVDYSAAKVPEYEGVAADYDGPRDLPASSDEYRDHAPDSSATLDYKYEQPPRRSDKSRSKEILQSNVEDADNWQTQERKQKKKSSNDDANLETLDKYSPHEMVPKFHPSSRLSIRPNHVKLRKTEREIKLPHTRNIKLKNRKDELQDDFDSESDFDLHDDYVYDKRSNVGIRATTSKAKKSRRKPRDRYVKSRQIDDTIEQDQDIIENVDTVTKKTYQDYLEDRKVIEPSMQRRLETDDEDTLKDYSDLMAKRQFYPVPMENKKKDPTDILTDTDTEFDRRMEPFDLSGKLLDTVDPEARVGMLSGGRRFGGLNTEGRRKDVALDPSLRLSDKEGKREKFRSKNFQRQQYDDDENYYDMKRVQNIKSKLPSLMRRTSKERTRATQRWRSSTRDLVWKNRRVFVPDPEKRDSTNTTTTSTTSTTTVTVTTVSPNLTTSIIVPTTLSKEELSLAEKSRLSILKKALRKENSVNVVTTQKPPVLMQMATNMQTLAMVEPASSQEPIFRATEVFDDNPSQLDKVKRLMRHKLVANAKDIRDLTDNWDDLVCVETSPSPAAKASVAERELTALLVARRHAPPANDTGGVGGAFDDAATTTPISCTFAPDAVDPNIDTEWTKFVKTNGKSVNSKDALEDKKDDSELWEAQAAFLGPNLWDKTLPYDPDLKVQEYVDLDEFLSENGMPGEALGGAHLGGAAFSSGGGLALGLQAPVTKRERSPSPSDCMSPDTINPPLSPADSTFSMASSGRDFDPRTRAFSDEELKPQPMIKKSRKQFVPDDLKDDKYWARRRKNNMAAKRSRDARRMKENQIALRAGYLEKENMGLRQEVELLKKENHILREKLSKYAEV